MTETGRSQILIADDDAVTRLVLRKIFEGQPDLEIVEAHSGTSAWRLLESGLQPDLCLLDISMPDLDGLSLLRKIRGSDAHKGMGAILCTASHDRATVEQAASLGVDYYILKPFNKALVLAQVRQALARSRKAPAPAALPAETERASLSTFVQQIEKLPSLPSIYSDLVQAVGRADSSISTVSNIILQDQSLTARLLKLANSVYYASKEVTSVEAAVQLVGLEQLQDLVLGTAVIRSFGNLSDEVISVASFWKHSIACAVTSELLAECRKDAATERLFIGGLLHDIGRLLMFMHAPGQIRRVLERCDRENQLSLRIERDIFGFDHAMLGAELASQWNLPKTFTDMIAWHHAPLKSSGPAPSDTFLVHYADFITTALEFGDSGEIFVSPLVIPGKAELAFVESHPIEGLAAQLEARCDAATRIFAEGEKALQAL